MMQSIVRVGNCCGMMFLYYFENSQNEGLLSKNGVVSESLKVYATICSGDSSLMMFLV